MYKRQGLRVARDGTYSYALPGEGTKTSFVDYQRNEVAELTIMNSLSLYDIVSPRYRMTRSLGLAWFAQDFARRFFEGGGMPHLMAFLKGLPNKPDAYANFTKDFFNAIRNAQESQRGILPLPAHIEKVENVGFSPDQTQMQESRQFQVLEVCRLYGLPPNILQSYENSTPKHLSLIHI